MPLFRGRIGVCSFGSRVSPRFDMSQQVVLFGRDMPDGEEMGVGLLRPEEIIKALSERGIKTLIVGGIHERYEEMFRERGICVIWGVIGEVREAMEAYAKGSLYSGIGDIHRRKRRGEIT
jgi:predicted Fe-Mo cluster-binding NifX family protein